MDKYEKVKKIGEGSFGKAILVKSKVDTRQYVIKEISISGMSTKERQESTKEVAVLANMSHPNIVQYKESFEEGGCLYIVMDYCEGGDLFKKINSQAGVLFQEDQILDWFVQICLALKHIHDRKILHRDIKSQNIFLTKEGTIQLGDFGIARVLNSTVEFARTCIGTPYYLSPEICENKPYNNKSDVWALGCVLYEMCTLKHAFEAGNMKNLVLKIIRGSYPPVSTHYSQDLRVLLGQVFRRNPRERPSVSTILAKPFLSCRIKKLLPPQIIAQEFSHDFLHKQPKVGVSHMPSAQKITKPASKYGVPLTVKKVSDGVKKAPEKKQVAANKRAPLPAAPQRRVSQVTEERKKHEEGIRKKMSLIEKERKQKEQMFLLKSVQMKRYTKEKINRINHAREQGWKHVLSSSGGSSPEKKCFVGLSKSSVGVSTPIRGTLHSPVSKCSSEHHSCVLEEISKLQPKDTGKKGSSPVVRNQIRGLAAAAGPVMPNNCAQDLDHDDIKRGLRRHISKQAHVSGHCSHMVAERTGQVEEFLQRKREAMLNKVRAEGQLEYLARLRQIRLQNFNERQQIKARLRGEKYDSDGSDSQGSTEEAELRRKKLDALKAQANTRAAVLKEQLEKKRREAFEREKKAWEDHFAVRGAKIAASSAIAALRTSESPPQPRNPQPDLAAKALEFPSSKVSTPATSLTVALKIVGANILQENSLKPDMTAEIQSKMKILRRLNQNLKGQNTVEQVEPLHPATTESGPSTHHDQPDTEKHSSSNGDRKKWEAADMPVLPLAQQTLEKTSATSTTPLSPEDEDRPSTEGDRKKWEAGVPLVLCVGQQTLEDTCIMTSEQTAGEVIQLGEIQEETQTGIWEARKDAEVLKVLQEAELKQFERTQQLQKTIILEDAFSHSDPVDIESLLLRECSKKASHSPFSVQRAWEKEAHQGWPPVLIKRSADFEDPAANANKSTESFGSVQHEEPLFMKLCSPAHRRTAALAILSAQSSMDDSSSSLTSRSRSVSPMRSKPQNALLIGLSTGMFDAYNPKMLRTCSLPDLGRLFSSQPEAAVTSESNAAPDNNLEIEDLDEAAKDDDQSEVEDACEYDDLRDVRASMERLLQEEGDVRDPLEVSDGDFNGNPPDSTDREISDGTAAEIDQDNSRMIVDYADDNDKEEQGGDDDDDDDDDDDEEYEECSNGSVGDEEEEVLPNGVGEDQHSNTHLNEEWQSDDSGDDQDRETRHHDSIFSRLEELRFNLEQQMGFEKFIQAYNKIKAMHEDEDENIDLGSSLVLSILGTEHQHLYSNILHLVMADGAYQEDNDE